MVDRSTAVLSKNISFALASNSTKGAERLSISLKNCGIYCTSEWLFSGIGVSPKLKEKIEESISINEENEKFFWNEDEFILKELAYFRQNNTDSIVTMIQDTLMLPLYGLGDFVGGKIAQNDDLINLIGLNCIIQTDDAIYVRILDSIKNKNVCTLGAYNSNDKLNDVKIIQAAEIVWHRRKSTFKNKIKE